MKEALFILGLFFATMAMSMFIVQYGFFTLLFCGAFWTICCGTIIIPVIMEYFYVTKEVRI